jgi:hypothetical protein
MLRLGYALGYSSPAPSLAWPGLEAEAEAEKSPLAVAGHDIRAIGGPWLGLGHAEVSVRAGGRMSVSVRFCIAKASVGVDSVLFCSVLPNTMFLLCYMACVTAVTITQLHPHMRVSDP